MSAWANYTDAELDRVETHWLRARRTQENDGMLASVQAEMERRRSIFFRGDEINTQPIAALRWLATIVGPHGIIKPVSALDAPVLAPLIEEAWITTSHSDDGREYLIDITQEGRTVIAINDVITLLEGARGIDVYEVLERTTDWFVADSERD
ncbi:hypothetical protein EHM76_07055 [bacterium]|nr:MAG: hypothetical protein EHM76_07055 [bacterium]